MAITANNKSLSSPILRYPTPSTLYIISESQDDDDRNYIGRLKNTLNAIVEASPILPRPKCLIIFHSKSLSFQDHLESVLVYAWSLQFLDFTIVIATANSQPLMFNYNAFTNMFYKRTLTAHMWLFPYKLRNMWAHPLKVPAIELPPYLYPIRDSSGKVIGMEGMSYQYVKIFSEVMNFTVDFITGAEDSVLRANFSVIFKKLYTNEIDMLTFPFNVRSIMYEFRDWLLMGKLFLNTNYVIVVPIVPLLRVDIPLEIMICIPLLAIIIFIYVVSAKLLHFPRGHWKVFKIFQILLGVTVMRKPPRKLVEKFVYFSLIVLSMKYSIDTLTKIMDIKLIKGEVAFDTLEEIATSKLPIYTLDFIIDHVYGNNDDETIEELRKKTFATVDMYQCVYQVVDNKSCMCITPHSAGVYVSKQFISADGAPTTKVARPSLYDDMAAFGFARASPLVSRLDELVQRVVESGISDSWTATQRYNIKPDDYEQRKPISENIFLIQLYAILSIGFAIASLAFAVEMLWELAFRGRLDRGQRVTFRR